MRKLVITLFVFSLTILSCGVVEKEMEIRKMLEEEIYIGMTFDEFKSTPWGKSGETVEMNDRRRVIKSRTIVTYGPIRFFYFNSDNKLYQMDEGVRQPDKTIEIK